MKIVCVVGARPNFMKIAPIVETIKAYPEIDAVLVHTGQHYDYEMSQIFFEQLDIPKSDVNLGIGSGSHANQTAQIMIAFEHVIDGVKPDMVLVVGDVNSTLSCALTSAKMNIPVAHVESGIRSFDKTMPEEINRIVVDHVSDYLFAPTITAINNLVKEGIVAAKVHLVGDVMIDTLLKYREKASRSQIRKTLNINSEYGLMTLHRPANVDNKDVLGNILDALYIIQKQIKIVLPLHPRTLAKITEYEFINTLTDMKNVVLSEPLGYLDFINLLVSATFILTDSGSIQTESSYLNIPCITMRANTERPETITKGTNVLVGNDSNMIIQECQKAINGEGKKGYIDKLNDGLVSKRIIDVIREGEL